MLKRKPGVFWGRSGNPAGPIGNQVVAKCDQVGTDSQLRPIGGAFGTKDQVEPSGDQTVSSGDQIETSGDQK